MSAALRPVVMSDRGMVVAGHHRAAEAGVAMLRAGGNAMDAAIAAAATLAVAVPHMNGLGGDAIALWFSPRDGKVVAINGSGAAPVAATPDRYRVAGLESVPQRGPLSISVPGAVHAWAAALQRFGTLSLDTVLAPAIDAAEHGILVDRRLQSFLSGPVYADLCNQWPALATSFGAPSPRRLGERIRQPALATTLRKLQRDGLDSLYCGSISRALLADLVRARAILSADDLARDSTRFEEALSVAFAGRRVYAAPPNSQGIALLLLLGLFDGVGFPTDAGECALRFLRFKCAAFRYRDLLVGDPDLFRLPRDLLTPGSLRRIAAGKDDMHPEAAASPSGDTSTLVAMDAEGNAVAWVQSLFEEFGSAVVSESTGIVLHNRLWGQSLDKMQVNTLRPGRRPFHTLCPAVAVSRGRCELAIATPGDHGQPQALAQVMLNLYARGVDVQEAIESPRLRHDSGAEVKVESRVPAVVIEALQEAGWCPADVGAWATPMGSASILRQEDGVMMGGADPRRSSYPASF